VKKKTLKSVDQQLWAFVAFASFWMLIGISFFLDSKVEQKLQRM
jgi:hypothetical protein